MGQDWQRDPGKTEPKSDGKTPSKVRRAARFVFTPRIGSHFQEMGRNNGMFVRLIAHIFAQQGLFPKDHPALRDERMPLKFTAVLAAGFESLDWTRDGLPKILFYFAVIATLAFGILGLLMLLAGVFSGTAHAGGTFTSPGGLAEDYGDQWLHYLSQGEATGFLTQLTNDGADATLLPTMFRTMAALYSTAMLVIAVVVLLYHLIVMIAHTAHDGQVMGKSAHQLWAPIRLVFALALLVPIGTNGFSSGQMLVFKIAEWGSGMASNIWNQTSTAFFQSVRLSSVPDVGGDDIIYNLMQIGFCAKYAQLNSSPAGPYEINGSFVADPADPLAPVSTPEGVISFAPVLQYDTNITGFAQLGISGPGLQTTIAPGGSLGLADYQNVNKLYMPGGTGRWWNSASCGKVSYRSPGADARTTSDATWQLMRRASEAHIVAFNAIEFDALWLGAALAVSNIRVEGSTGLITRVGGADWNVARDLQAMRDLYKETYMTYATGGGLRFRPGTTVLPYPTLETTDPQTLLGLNEDGVAGEENSGWMSAGSLFVKLVSKNSAFAELAATKPEVTYDPEGCAAGQGNCAGFFDAKLGVENRQDELEQRDESFISRIATSMKDAMVSIGCDIMKKFGLMNSANQWVWNTMFIGANPVQEMIQFGGKLIDGGVFSMILGMALQPIADLATVLTAKGKEMSEFDSNDSVVKSYFKGLLSGISMQAGWLTKLLQFAAIIGPILTVFGGLILAPGIVLYYWLPMLPFITFNLGILTWIVSLMQAVIAIPVIALAHITPHGEGLPSQRAAGAYLILLQIFLRPLMMIVGLVVAVILMNTGIAFLNKVFFLPFDTGLVGAGSLFGKVLMFIMYTVCCYGVVKAAIECIDLFPANAVKWIGGSSIDHDFSQHGRGMAQAMLATSAMSQVQGALGASGDRLQKFIKGDPQQIAGGGGGGGGGGSSGSGENMLQAGMGEVQEMAAAGGPAGYAAQKAARLSAYGAGKMTAKVLGVAAVAGGGIAMYNKGQRVQEAQQDAKTAELSAGTKLANATGTSSVGRADGRTSAGEGLASRTETPLPQQERSMTGEERIAAQETDKWNKFGAAGGMSSEEVQAARGARAEAKENMAHFDVQGGPAMASADRNFIPAAGRSAASDKKTRNYAAKVQDIMSEYNVAMNDASRMSGLPAQLIAAHAAVESGGNARAVSPTGPMGLMQFGERTAIERGLNVEDNVKPQFAKGVNGATNRDELEAYAATADSSKDERLNPRSSAIAAAQYVADLTQRYHGDTTKAFVAYNRGVGIVKLATQRAEQAGEPDNWANYMYSADTPLDKRDAEAAENKEKGLAYANKIMEHYAAAGGYIMPSPAEQRQQHEHDEVMAKVNNYLKENLGINRNANDHAVDGLDDEYARKLASMVSSMPKEVREDLRINSGWRSIAEQQHGRAVADAAHGSEAGKHVGQAAHINEQGNVEGGSYHNHGQALDWGFASAEARQWVHNNAGSFGFYFPSEKYKDINLMANEPWHMEMEGSRDARGRKLHDESAPFDAEAGGNVAVASNAPHDHDHGQQPSHDHVTADAASFIMTEAHPTQSFSMFPEGGEAQATPASGSGFFTSIDTTTGAVPPPPAAKKPAASPPVASNAPASVDPAFSNFLIMDDA